jgi:plastocyanin
VAVAVKRLLLAGAALAPGTTLAAGTAAGADGTVEARPDNTFAPQRTTVAAGETVTFRNAGGNHDVVFEGARQPRTPSVDSWVFARRFTKPGTYPFYCSVHGGPRGKGMSGTVIVTGDPTITSIFSARPAAKRFTGGAIRLRVNLSEPSHVTGALQRRRGDGAYVHAGNIRVAARTGRSTVRVTRTAGGKRILPGRYHLKLSALGRTTTVRFTMSSR